MLDVASSSSAYVDYVAPETYLCLPYVFTRQLSATNNPFALGLCRVGLNFRVTCGSCCKQPAKQNKRLTIALVHVMVQVQNGGGYTCLLGPNDTVLAATGEQAVADANNIK
jgi:hypothetical protein